MGNSEDKNLGQEIQDMVQDAVRSMDFQELDRKIGNTAKSAIEDYKFSRNSQPEQGAQDFADKAGYKIVRDANGRFQKIRTGAAGMAGVAGTGGAAGMADSAGRAGAAGTAGMAQRRTQGQAQKNQQVKVQQRQEQRPQVRRTAPLIDNKPAGRISSVIFTVLGGCFSFFLGLAIMILGVIGIMEWESGCILAAMILAPLFVGSAALLATGVTQSKRLQRFRQYVRILNGRTYAMLDEFAATVGKSRPFVLRDVQKMISLRMFPYGRLDNEGTCLILNNETWQQYMALKNQMRQQELREEEQKRIEEEDPFQREVAKTLKAGEDYLSQIRAANDAIPGEEISRKLDNLELIIRRIFEQLRNHPEKIPEMNKFMDYYLPTTLKLVNAYREFDGHSLPTEGENISGGKREIEKTLDTINKAFLNLFDSLFADTAMDISTDISVLRTMLAQEGLTDSDFSLNRN